MTTTRASTTHSVASRDGTSIGYTSSGAGRPLVVVHGTSADHRRWGSVRPLLEAGRAVHAVDRRGRGLSGDGAHYSIEREYEDVAAVVDAVAEADGTGVDVMGHSYGALCVLGAAALTSRARRIVLYEPPADAGGLARPEVLDELDALLTQGRRSDAVASFFRTVVGVPERELELIRALPTWHDRTAAAHTIARELRSSGGYRLDPQRVRAVTAPVLLLLGGESPAPFRSGTEQVARTLPDARVGILPGQQHIAMDTAPELFAEAVDSFLADAGE
ncbi:alpha/beta fold hydrolase [Nocardiopsis aegyptia]|uniref:Pimeloyl-ACP methyl ester carboxylesterase n=1 Tax=Nocardiopsis aegyptia TaxID=220378 RepID=A0A7Z0EU24_9ACTN|nr:alpha/beta hydrolase [Nocardiopsis aegyptia]NYJ37821.1 pimeloyl-ACP methyl ester carboxylesterase [Nocardiopsis aegyptia]